MNNGSWLKVKKAIVLFFVSCFLLSAMGCEAFVRKFTRKPKQESLEQEQVVMVPEEYKGQAMGKEELYRQYFLFWKSWQEEFINSLRDRNSHKRQIDCAEEAIKNLSNLKNLLNEEKRKKLDGYIGQCSELKELVVKDLYGSQGTMNAQTAERLKRDIMRDLSYSKIKDSLI
jgi:hypothetical protein